MNVEKLFTDIILKKSIKPVSKVYLKRERYIFINVEFIDGLKVSFKIDYSIQAFMCIIKNVNFVKKDLPKNACITSPLGFFKIFGFVENDTARFVEDDQELFILFSSSL